MKPTTLIAALLFTGSAFSQASVIVTTSKEAPTENVAFRVPGSTASDATGVIAQNATRPAPLNYLISTQGQSFSLSETTTVKTVVFRLPPVVTIRPIILEAEVDLTFYSMPGPDSNVPTGELKRYSFTMPANLAASDYLHFELDEPFTLSADVYYGVEFSFRETALNQTLNFDTGATQSGIKRMMWYRELVDGEITESWKTGGGALNMHLIAIPEPGSVALLIGAGLPLAWGMRRLMPFRRK